MTATKINVIDRSLPEQLFEFEDGEMRCAHQYYEIEPPCCSGIDSEGNPSCGCHGMTSVSCDHGCELTDTEVEEIIERETPDGEMY